MSKIYFVLIFGQVLCFAQCLPDDSKCLSHPNTNKSIQISFIRKRNETGSWMHELKAQTVVNNTNDQIDLNVTHTNVECNGDRIITIKIAYGPELHEDQPNIKVDQRVLTKRNITLFRTTVGSDIIIPCNAKYIYLPGITWYKDDVSLVSSERVQLGDPKKLIILGADTSDSGTYRCEARSPTMHKYSEVYSRTLSVLVESVTEHQNCTDEPIVPDCSLVVKAKYCYHTYYARFCCRSCLLAGLLPSEEP